MTQVAVAQRLRVRVHDVAGSEKARKQPTDRKRDWQQLFLATLRKTGSTAEAVKAAKVTWTVARGWRRRHPDFADQWDEAREDGLLTNGSPLDDEDTRQQLFAGLRQGESTSKAARRIGLTRDQVDWYRRQDTDFAAQYAAVLEEAADFWEDELARVAIEGEGDRRGCTTAIFGQLRARRPGRWNRRPGSHPGDDGVGGTAEPAPSIVFERDGAGDE